MTQNLETDVLVIGAGNAAFEAARSASELMGKSLGQLVGVYEERDATIKANNAIDQLEDEATQFYMGLKGRDDHGNAADMVGQVNKIGRAHV